MKIPSPVLLGWLLASACATSSSTAEGKAFQDKAAQEPGAVRTSSGLIYQETLAGTGRSPRVQDFVKVHYRGTLVDGKEFDSSYERRAPETFSINDVIPCWTEGLQRMKEGGKARLICPPELAYGVRGAPPVIRGNATLVFEVELVKVLQKP